MKALTLFACAISCLAVSAAAHADYTFSGSSSNGYLSGSTEPYAFNYDFQFGGTTPDFGSPGVDANLTAYTQTQAAYGFTISFSGGGTIDSGSVALGNASACAGSTTGGTTFCNISAGADIFEAFITAPDTIEFLAQSPTYGLTTGDAYFVNIFFDGSTPTSFTGSFLTEFTPTPTPPSVTPEPSSMVLLGTGAVGLFYRRFQRK